MPTTEDILDTLLEDTSSSSYDILELPIGDSAGIVGESWAEPGYEGKIDYRIRQLSYSSLLTLHSCPRKYQLYKLRSSHRAEESLKSNITFSFGHVVGEAIQMAFEGASEAEIIWRAFLVWNVDIFAEDEKANKSFWAAIIAIKRFLAARESGFLRDYELVYYNGKPACELSFCINFPDGFRYRGHVDLVIRHKITGEVVVLECKTTGAASTNPTQYKNSAQAIGYSIVLDAIFPDISAYKVIYLVYNTKQGEYQTFEFQKTFLQRALWIRELLLDIETIKMYEEAEIYPMRGESCLSFYRDCEYLATCTLSTEYLTKPCTPEQEDKTEYQVDISLADLIQHQLNKEVKT